MKCLCVISIILVLCPSKIVSCEYKEQFHFFDIKENCFRDGKLLVAPNEAEIVTITTKLNILEPYALDIIKKAKDVGFEENGLIIIRPNVFQHISGLETVGIYRNELNILFQGMFTNMTIKHLHLHSNGIKYIQPATFDNLPNLLRLNVNNNELGMWNPDWFKDSEEKLRYLQLSNNSISSIQSRAFVRFPSLQRLDLSHNKISYLSSNAFAETKNLTNLNLNHNRLISVNPDAFQENFHYKKRKFSYIDLMNNNLSYVAPATLEAFRNWNHVVIANNPWTCPCYHKIVKWASENNIKFYNPHGLVVSYWDQYAIPQCVVPNGNVNECIEGEYKEEREYYSSVYNYVMSRKNVSGAVSGTNVEIEDNF